MMEPLRSFEDKWRKLSGTPRQRKQTIRSLEKAADALETLLDTVDAVVAEDLSSDPVVADRLEQSWRMFMLLPDFWSGGTIAVPELSVTIDGLRTYASVLRSFDLPLKDIGASPADMLAKYLFSAYVVRATTRFHDAEVSALIGATLGTFYDETAHRMWRKRNYKRIDKNFSSTLNMLTDVGSVLGT